MLKYFLVKKIDRSRLIVKNKMYYSQKTTLDLNLMNQKFVVSK